MRADPVPAAEVLAGWQVAVGRSRAPPWGIPSASAAQVVPPSVQHAKDPAHAERTVRDHLRDRVDAPLDGFADTRLDDEDDHRDEPQAAAEQAAEEAMA